MLSFAEFYECDFDIAARFGLASVVHCEIAREALPLCEGKWHLEAPCFA